MPRQPAVTKSGRKPANRAASQASNILEKLKSLPSLLATDAQAAAFRQIVGQIQDLSFDAAEKIVTSAAAPEMIRIIDATVASPRGKKFAEPVLFALKILGYFGTQEGTEVIIRTAAGGFAPTAYSWSVVLGVFGEGHPGAKMLFAALAKKLPEKFLGISVLDAANTACREHSLKNHPFDSKEGVVRLSKLLGNLKSNQASYAVSACAAIPFLSAARRRPLVALARKHKNVAIRLEIAWATAKLSDKAGLEYLVSMCMDPNYSMQARTYLKELKQATRIPKKARNPDFAALSEMCQWLAHPHEFGQPPTSIAPLDKRSIYWPPAGRTHTLRLFKYEYAKSLTFPTREVGVGMVGSVTFALFGETKPDMKPEDIYGIHCCWELEIAGDPRAPKKRSGKAGWKLIEAGTRASPRLSRPQRTTRKTSPN